MGIVRSRERRNLPGCIWEANILSTQRRKKSNCRLHWSRKERSFYRTVPCILRFIPWSYGRTNGSKIPHLPSPNSFALFLIVTSDFPKSFPHLFQRLLSSSTSQSLNLCSCLISASWKGARGGGGPHLA